MSKEQYLRIDGSDQNGIYGKLRKQENECLIIHLHGMTHTMHHMLEVTSADFFTEANFDHYRIGFYDRMPDSRRLNTSTLSTHITDIKTVLAHFKLHYKKIFITAHSLSGLCTVIANLDVTAISLWDPSFDVTHFWKVAGSLTHIPERKEYYMDYGNVFVISEDMVDEIAQYPDAKCLELHEKMKAPTQMIIPEETLFLASPHTSPDNYTQFQVGKIAGANHVFSNPNDRAQLFEKTLEWFSQY